jgi:SAM-dependent methyltransferase
MRPTTWYDAAYFETEAKGFGPQDAGIYYGVAETLAQGFPEVRRLLDVGCGQGLLVREFLNRGYEAYGCDFSLYAVTHPGEGVPAARLAGANLVEGLPYHDAQFDLVLSWQVLEHLTGATVEQALHELTRVARGWQVHSICLAPPHSAPRQDPAHTLLQTPDWWQARFVQQGWRLDGDQRARLNAFGGWDSPEFFVARVAPD